MRRMCFLLFIACCVPDANAWWHGSAVSGWTSFTATAGGCGVGTCVIKVSNSAGNDATCAGTSPPVVQGSDASSCKTLAKALTLAHNGKPDWILLKKGDTWTNEAFDNLTIVGGTPVIVGDLAIGATVSGVLLISSYGLSTSRPLIKTNISSPNATAIGASGGGGGDNMAIVGIEFYSYTRDPANGSYAGSGTTEFGIHYQSGGLNWLLIEDVRASFYAANQLSFDLTSLGTLVIRRNVITDAWSATGVHATGMFLFCNGATPASTPIINENLFDHNGWNASIVGAERTIFSRNFYIDEVVTAMGNISSNSAAEGAEWRRGGTIEKGLYVADSDGFDIGHDQSQPVTTTASVRYNVILNSNDIDGSNQRGGGINVLNSSGSGVNIHDNIIAHTASASPGTNAEAVIMDSAGAGTAGTDHILVQNNIIYDYVQGIVDTNSGSTGNVITPNAVELNNSNTAGYKASVTTQDLLGVYAGSLGLTATTAAFIAQAKLESKDNYHLQYHALPAINFIRDIFNLGPVSANDNTPMWLNAVA